MGEHRMLMTERMFGEIKYLMRAMARDIVNPDHWALSFDDVLADMYFKMVELVNEYDGKPFDELKALVIKSLHNYKATLKGRYYKTYRVIDLGILDIDLVDNSSDASNEMSDFILDDFLASLTSDDSRLLVQEVLQPSERTRWFIRLALIRKRATSPNDGWVISITPLLMERALGWDKQRLETAWEQVASGFREYISENV